MLIQLNTSDDRPIYAQIVDQVKFAIAAGVVRPGDLVPSVRELSKRLVVNPNTVARAYRELQGAGAAGAGAGDGACRSRRRPPSVAARSGGRSSGSGSGRRSRRRCGATWRPPRSRRSSARNGPGAMGPRRAGGHARHGQRATRGGAGR